jgi:hypothetical protein
MELVLAVKINDLVPVKLGQTYDNGTEVKQEGRSTYAKEDEKNVT